MSSYLKRARSKRLSSSSAAGTSSSSPKKSSSNSTRPAPRFEGLNCLLSPAMTTFFALRIEGIPFSTNIWDASSNITRSKTPVCRGIISETTSGVSSQILTLLNSSKLNLFINLFTLHLRLLSITRRISPCRFDIVRLYISAMSRASSFCLVSFCFLSIASLIFLMMPSKLSMLTRMSLCFDSNFSICLVMSLL